MKKKRFDLKILIGLVIGIILSFGATYGAILANSNNAYYNKTGTNLTSNNVQGAITELANKYETQCPPWRRCVYVPNVAIGDYVRYTAATASFTAATASTGASSAVTFNPKELTLWRVIKINPDGSVDAISDQVSSKNITFTGQTGYKNLVGYLNVLASKYANSTYTSGTRHFGYSTQTPTITSSLNTTSAPWTCSTGESCNPVESQGGGDLLYVDDYQRVLDVYGELNGYNGPSARTYWVASREYVYNNVQYSPNYNSWTYYGRYISTEASTTPSRISRQNLYSAGPSTGSGAHSLRPIVTFKVGLVYSGTGTASSPKTISLS